jgi:predicted ATPase
VEAIVRERIEGLCPASRAVLDMAAVEGEEFCAETVAAALGLPAAEVIGILSGALGRQRHLVTSVRMGSVGDRRASLYRFRHALFQRYLYETLDAAERAFRHDRLAEVIGSTGDEETAER